MSSLEKLRKQYDEDDLKILLINLHEDEVNVSSFIEARGYTNTVLLDSESEAAKAFQVVGIPIAYLIDKKGGVADRYIGYVNWNSEKIKSVIDGLLEEG